MYNVLIKMFINTERHSHITKTHNTYSESSNQEKEKNVIDL